MNTVPSLTKTQLDGLRSIQRGVYFTVGTPTLRTLNDLGLIRQEYLDAEMTQSEGFYLTAAGVDALHHYNGNSEWAKRLVEWINPLTLETCKTFADDPEARAAGWIPVSEYDEETDLMMEAARESGAEMVAPDVRIWDEETPVNPWLDFWQKVDEWQKAGRPMAPKATENIYLDYLIFPL